MSRNSFWFLLGAAVLTLLIVAVDFGQAAQAVPEVIDDGHYMAVTEDHIYYSTDGSSELKCEDLVNEVYGRVPNGGGQADHVQLLTNCQAAPFPGSAMVSNGRVTYFISYVQTVGIHALFRRRADGSEKAKQVTLDQNLAERALVNDEGHVYYATLEGTNSQILRRDVVSGATQTVAAIGDLVGSSVNGLALDDKYIYWTEGDAGGNGRVRRALKDGGPPAVVADALALPVDIMVSGNYVYWTETVGQRIARRLKDGAGATDSVYETDRPVTTLFLFNNVIYFGTGEANTPNGSVWRVSANGNNPILMAYDFPPPRDIAWVDGWIYWVDGKLRRLPPNAVSDVVDYGIERMEVTQGVQNGGNSIPLISRKTTMVRVYARELSGPSDNKVSARLYGYRDGVALPDSPLGPIVNKNLDLGNALPSRAETNKTYVFQLPNEWTKLPDLELQAEVNPNNQVFETNFGNNLYPAAPESFDPADRLVCLVTYPVAAKTPAGGTIIFDNDPAVFDSRILRARTLLPTLLMVVKESTVIWLEDGDGQQLPHDIPVDPNESMLLAAIGNTGELSDPPEGCLQAATRYAGIVDETADYSALFGGRADGNRWWGRWWDAGGEDYILPAGGFLFAHETGHTLGRPHVDCGGAGDPGYYPYPRCDNYYFDGENAPWGYDPISGAAPNPVDNPDLMAYGAPRWVSDFTWKCIYDYVGDIWGLPGTGQPDCDSPLTRMGPTGQEINATTPEDGTIIIIDATINFTGLEATSLFAYNDMDLLTKAQEERLRDTPRQGPYKAILLDARGNEVASKFIESGGSIHDSDGKSSNQLSAALRSAVQPNRVEIRETASGKLLFEQALSDNAPRLNLTAARMNRDGDMVVDFTAKDPDGDPVQIIAQYIEPEGRKQIMAHTRLWQGSQYKCDPCTWPGRTLHGGTGMVRIFATDGLLTSVVEKRVSVPAKSPEVSLYVAQHGSPDDDGFATFGVWATVWDAEDGSIPILSPLPPPSTPSNPTSGLSLAWSVDGQPVAGHFDEVIFVARKDSGETYQNQSTSVTVDLTVTDSDKRSTTATVEVDLQPEKPPPPTPGDTDVYLPVVLSSS